MISPLRGGHQSHGRAQQRGLAGAVGADQDGGLSNIELERNAIEDRHLAGEDPHIYEHYGEVERGVSHAHPA